MPCPSPAAASLVMAVGLMLLAPAPAPSAGTRGAEPPRVLADVPPVQSLVARVMQGVGTPGLLLPPGTSPHHHALRPSDARALGNADLVVWIGPGLTPSLVRPLDSLASGARVLMLTGVPGMHLRPLRTGAHFHADHEHGAGAGQAADVAPAAEAHDAADDPDGHAEDPAGGAPDAGPDDAHDHGDAAGAATPATADPHLWLDPANARTIVAAAAEALAAIDPVNAAVYRANADAARADLEALEAEIAARLAPVTDRPFVVFHDAYGYFEERFGLWSAGAIQASDAVAAGGARVAAVRAAIVAEGAVCVFAEVPFQPRMVATVTEGTGARSATLDPTGAGLTPGAALYPQLMRNLAATIADCLAG